MSTTSPPPVDPTGAAWNNYVNSQSFNVTSLKGTPVTLSFPQIDSLAYLRTSTGIVSGFAIGFCAQLFIILLLLTPKERRRQPIYLLNMTSLFLLTFINICRAIIYCSTYQNSGPQLLGAFFAYGKTTWVPLVLQAIINPLLFASIMTSLVLQTRVVFAAEPITRHTITLVGALAILGEFGIAVTNSVYSVLLQYRYPEIVVVPQWIYRTQRLYFVVFVAICCAVFLWKLARTILRRRRMGMDIKQFGPFQIVLIMFTQCLIVPLVIYILDYTLNSRSIYVIIAQVTLVSSLPLSALWASADQHHKDQQYQRDRISASTVSESVRRGRFTRFRGHWGSSSESGAGTRTSKDSHSDIEKAPSYHAGEGEGAVTQEGRGGERGKGGVV